MGWTKERVTTLKELWAEGLSASLIAGRLGDVTRNAVIGKIHRLGLCGYQGRRSYPKPGFRKGTRRRRRKPRVAKTFLGLPIRASFCTTKPPIPYKEPIDDTPVPLARRKTIQNLGENDCKWPKGDPSKKDFHFCGDKRVPGLSYCKHHAPIAYAGSQRQSTEPVSPEVAAKRAAKRDYMRKARELAKQRESDYAEMFS